MDEYTLVIIVTLVGFSALAALLLVPVYKFLKKEEQISENWTPESLSEADSGLNDAETDYSRKEPDVS